MTGVLCTFGCTPCCGLLCWIKPNVISFLCAPRYLVIRFSWSSFHPWEGKCCVQEFVSKDALWNKELFPFFSYHFLLPLRWPFLLRPCGWWRNIRQQVWFLMAWLSPQTAVRRCVSTGFQVIDRQIEIQSLVSICCGTAAKQWKCKWMQHWDCRLQYESVFSQHISHLSAFIPFI